MTKLIHGDDALVSTLKEGIIIGILAALRQHKLPTTKDSVALILEEQQHWSEHEIEHFSEWLLIFNIRN